MAQALIIGGGAIGRGYIPWLLEEFELDILDTSTGLVNGLIERGGFHSFMSDGDQLKKKCFRLLECSREALPDSCRTIHR